MCKVKDQCECNLALQKTNSAPFIELLMGTNMEFHILVVNNGDEPAYDAKLSVTSEQKLPPLKLQGLNCEGGNERCGGDSCEVCKICSPSNTRTFKNSPYVNLQNDIALQVATTFECKLPMIAKDGKRKKYTFKFDTSKFDTSNPFNVKTAKLQIELTSDCAAQDDDAQLEIDLDLKFKYIYKVKRDLVTWYIH